MDDSNKMRVATPLLRRIRLVQQRFLPVVVWCVALGMAVMLARHRTGYVDAVGVVEVRETMVAPLVDGTIRAMSVDLLDNVEAGTVIAMMDDTLVRAELVTAEAELSRLRAELEANRDRLQLEAEGREIDALALDRRFMLNEEEARLDYLDRLVQRETDRVTLDRLRILFGRQEILLREGVTSREMYDETRLQYEALKTALQENESAIALAEQRMEETRQRREEHEDETTDVGATRLVQAPTEGIHVQETLIRQIMERRKTLVLTAPLSGKVTAMFHRTGETVLSGDPLLSITDSKSERVLAYVDERAAKGIDVGTKVEARSRHFPSRIVTAKVLKLSAKMEEFPLHLRRNPLLPQWGLSVLVGEIPTDLFYPGEVLNLRFLRSAETG